MQQMVHTLHRRGAYDYENAPHHPCRENIWHGLRGALTALYLRTSQHGLLACWLASLLYKSAAPPQPRERESVVAGPTININNCDRKGPHRATFHPPRHDTWSGRNIYLGGGVFPLTAVNRTSPIARVSINGNRSLRRRKLEVETDDYYYETFVGTLRHLAA